MSPPEAGTGGAGVEPSTGSNVLVLMADQHTRSVLGASGDPCAVTPHLDGLARRGTVFSRAYSSSPLCVPARAAMATGRHVHQLGCWDNHVPYDGTQADSWGHRLLAARRRVATVGKLHYRSAEAATGFDEQLVPMHVSPDVGGVRGLLRGGMPPVRRMRAHVEDAGPGESEYTAYDRDVARTASRWLREEAPSQTRPWALVVSFVSPHFPLVCPEEHLRAVDAAALPFPTDGDADVRDQHPAVRVARRLQCLDEPFTRDEVMRAVAAYYGLVSFVDEQVGRVLDALDGAGLRDGTRVLYTSDHGEMLGEHGLWWKSCLYEGSVGVPMIVAGPGIPAGATNDTPVSSVDLFPTVLDWSGVPTRPDDADLPGSSLARFLHQPEPGRLVLSEYHGVFSGGASYLLTPVDGRFAYLHHVRHPPQLFDLVSDPGQRHDLAGDGAFAAVLRRAEEHLKSLLDPEATDREARASQQRRIDVSGGREAVLALAGSFTHTPAPTGAGDGDGR